ncbi:TPA: (4Fe-4S)-binding protein, partial [Acinetobacter baumannii]|nr:(4Fe-4S)-binding protein [Acinetobacter baumannii]
IDCIKQDPAHIENEEQLLEKFKGLNLLGESIF